MSRSSRASTLRRNNNNAQTRNGNGNMGRDNIARINQLTQSLDSAISRFSKVAGADTRQMEKMRRRAKNYNAGVVGHPEYGYSWRSDGNLVTTPMSSLSALQTADYNAVYATIGGPHFPVPKPQTNSESNGFSYTANVGFLSLTRTYVSPSNETTYIVITCTPEAVNPIHVCSRVQANNNFSFPPSNGDYKKNNAPTATSNWVQTDPRIMVAGENPSPSAFQQFMGGEVRGMLSVPWNGIATIGVLDPLISPSYLGNKMNHLANSRTGYDITREFEYYALNGVHVHGAGSQDMPASRLFEMASSRAVINGGGNASTFGFGWRQIPNTQEWTYLANNADIVPGPFNGSPIIVIELPPSQTISLSMSGFLGYNVSVDPTSAVGALLSQDSPIATPHSTNVRNIPMTVNCGTTSVHPEFPFTGIKLPTNTSQVQPSIGSSVMSSKGVSGLGNVISALRRVAAGGLNAFSNQAYSMARPHLKGVLNDAAIHMLMKNLATRAYNLAASHAGPMLQQLPKVVAGAMAGLPPPLFAV